VNPHANRDSSGAQAQVQSSLQANAQQREGFLNVTQAGRLSFA